MHTEIVAAIRQYFQLNNCKRAVVGISGGIDSALSAGLTAEAIGAGNLHALIMPETGLTAKQNISDAIGLCKHLRIQYTVIPIDPMLDSFGRLPWRQARIASMNTKSRIRSLLLYNYANSLNCLVIGTSNKTEIRLGYYTKYGDGAVDLEVIGSLYKTEVYRLAEKIGIPKSIIAKKPTAELASGQTDEDELGGSYDDIDAILRLMDQGKGKDEIAGASNDSNLVEAIIRRIRSTEHKRHMPPVILDKGLI
ncbi:MAG: NAD+ synthase [archaeon]